MAWTDIFLIPFNVALKQTRDVLMIRSKSLDCKCDKAIELRTQFLDKLKDDVSYIEFSDLYLMIFGEEPKEVPLEDTNENILNHIKILNDFMENVHVDTIDKIMIEQLMVYYDNFLEEHNN